VLCGYAQVRTDLAAIRADKAGKTGLRCWMNSQLEEYEKVVGEYIETLKRGKQLVPPPPSSQTTWWA
jgi:hypothetical protein